MKIVLLSGGKGKRLWPLSTDNVPKQFVPLFNDASSMLKKHMIQLLKIMESIIFILLLVMAIRMKC